MRNCILPALYLLIAVSSHGDDLDPPEWRGTGGSTYQEWDFLFLPDSTNRQSPADCVSLEDNDTPWGDRGSPDKFNNPFQEKNRICVEFKTMWAITDKIDWLEEYNGRPGVWRLSIDSASFNSLDFIIPNKSSLKLESKEIQVQITYEGLKLHPIVRILILLPGEGEKHIYLESVDEYQSGILPEGWLQRTFKFQMDFCPRFENVRLFPHDRGELFIDKVVIDTICR